MSEGKDANRYFATESSTRELCYGDGLESSRKEHGVKGGLCEKRGIQDKLCRENFFAKVAPHTIWMCFLFPSCEGNSIYGALRDKDANWPMSSINLISNASSYLRWGEVGGYCNSEELLQTCR